MMTSSHTEEGNFRTYVEQLPYLTEKKNQNYNIWSKENKEEKSELIPPFSVLRQDFRLILIFCRRNYKSIEFLVTKTTERNFAADYFFMIVLFFFKTEATF